MPWGHPLLTCERVRVPPLSLPIAGLPWPHSSHSQRYAGVGLSSVAGWNLTWLGKCHFRCSEMGTDAP
jgi:hypothetical protein